MESTLTVSEVAERCLPALGGGRARRRDQTSRGPGGWGEAVSGCSGLEVRVWDAAKEQMAIRGGHGWRRSPQGGIRLTSPDYRWEAGG